MYSPKLLKKHIYIYNIQYIFLKMLTLYNFDFIVFGEFCGL